jgi:hypothetical protein
MNKGHISEPIFVNLLRSSEIDSLPGVPVQQPFLTYRPAKLHRLEESILAIKVFKYKLWSQHVNIVYCKCFSNVKEYTVNLGLVGIIYKIHIGHIYLFLKIKDLILRSKRLQRFLLFTLGNICP